MESKPDHQLHEDIFLGDDSIETTVLGRVSRADRNQFTVLCDAEEYPAKLRGVFREKRIGHAGTLDPMATGVLPVFIGRATRAVEFASESSKEYIAGLKLGVITNTQDTTGEVLETRPVTATREDLEQVLDRFRGPIEQLPPMYSAIKINGKNCFGYYNNL